MRFQQYTLFLLLVSFIAVPYADEPPLAKQPLQHIVLLWLKPDIKQATRNRIMNETRALSAIPGVGKLIVGPSISSKRKIVDDSFDIGIKMEFDSVEHMNKYLKHPRHIEFVDKFIKPNISKIIVYDF